MRWSRYSRWACRRGRPPAACSPWRSWGSCRPSSPRPQSCSSGSSLSRGSRTTPRTPVRPSPRRGWCAPPSKNSSPPCRQCPRPFRCPPSGQAARQKRKSHHQSEKNMYLFPSSSTLQSANYIAFKEMKEIYLLSDLSLVVLAAPN